MPGPTGDFYDYSDPAAWAADEYEDPIGDSLVSSDVLESEGVQTFAEDMFATSDDGSIADDGITAPGASIGDAVADLLPEDPEPIVVGDVIAGPGSSAAARDIGYARGYTDGYNGAPYTPGASTDIEPELAEPFLSGYDQGYTLGKQDKSAGKPSLVKSGTSTPAKTGASTVTTTAPDASASGGLVGWWNGLSATQKAVAGVAGGVAVIGGVVLVRRSMKRRRAA